MQGVKYDGQGPSLEEINAVYRSVLGRDADPEGLAYWDKTNLAVGDLTNSFKGSDEYRAIQAKGSAQGAPAQPTAPKPAAAQQPAQQTPSQQNKQPFNGVQYDGKGPTLDQINQLYVSLLGREADPLGLGAYDKANYDLKAIQRSILESEEFRNNTGFDLKGAIKDAIGGKSSLDKNTLLRAAIARGEDLTDIYGGTYADSVRLLEDLGLGPSRYGKDNTIIVPASPTGYQGAWKFDPVFGSTYYRDAALEMGRQLGIPESEVRKAAGKIAMDRLYTDNRQQRAMLGSSTADNLLPLLTGALLDKAGVKDQKARDSVIGTVTQQVKDIGGQLHSVSDSSGFFKQVGKSIADLGPIGTIALAAALGPAGAGVLGTAGAAAAAAAAPGVLQGDFEGALKSGALAGLSAGVLKGLDSTISNAVGGGIPGDIVGGAAKGAITGGAGALVNGGDFKDGLINGAIAGGAVAGVTSGVNALTGSGKPAGYDGTKQTPAVGGIDDSSNDLGKSIDYGTGYDGKLGSTKVGGIDDSNFDLGKSVEAGLGYDGTFGSPKVGGIDDSGNDVGKSVDRLNTITAGSKSNSKSNLNGGAGAIVGPIAGGLIANEIIGSRNKQQVNTPAVQSPAANAQAPQTQPVAGGATAAGPLDGGSFNVGASGSSGNGKAARLNLQSLFGDSMFAQQNEYLRSIL